MVVWVIKFARGDAKLEFLGQKSTYSREIIVFCE
jgi:hypothetical protein